MKNKPYQLKFTSPWEKDSGFGRRPKMYVHKPAKIIANPAVVMKVLRRKKILIFLTYFVLVALTMLNLINYRRTKEPQQCNHQVLTSRVQRRPDIRSLLDEPPMRPRQLVYVLTTWRSGSSFFGELFNQHPDAFFIYEPMWHIWQKLYPGDAVALQGAARDMLNSLFRCDLSAYQMYSNYGPQNLSTLQIFGSIYNKVTCSYPLCPAYRKNVVGMVDENICKKCPYRSLHLLEQECLKYDTVVIKGVRILDMNILAPLMKDPNLNLKIIHLVRDPRAVANSRINSKHGLIRENMQVIRSRDPKSQIFDQKMNKKDSEDYHSLSTMEVVCEFMMHNLKIALDPPTWLKGKYMTVRYEDLVENPIKSMRSVYSFVNLTSSHDLEGFALNMTSGNKSTYEPFMVSSRNATKAANAWRTVLSYQQIQQVEEYCGQAMSLLGYLPVRSPMEAKNLSKSLLTQPKV
ncbi:carbohydrate sulfotransferase 2a [Hoplias malabaricus]|uniref:carbohydrate sulfotransferase 2a n=1 Tax=Hoplias malabaricus TaxID=27720 RepID=UPI00346370D8